MGAKKRPAVAKPEKAQAELKDLVIGRTYALLRRSRPRPDLIKPVFRRCAAGQEPNWDIYCTDVGASFVRAFEHAAEQVRAEFNLDSGDEDVSEEIDGQ